MSTPTEPQNTIDLLSDDGRQKIASRLRHMAEQVAEGKVTLDTYNLEPEWHATAPSRTGFRRCSPTGRVFLTLGYWQTPVTELPE